MNAPTDRIGKLQALLAKVQQNAAALASQRGRREKAPASESMDELEMELESVDDSAEPFEDDLLMTIPPDARDSAPGAEGEEFELPSSMPPSGDIEAPPISTQQERADEELDGLGASLGFRPSQAPEAMDEAEEEPGGAPRTPPPESGPQRVRSERILEAAG